MTTHTKRDRGEGRIYRRGKVWWIGYSHRGRKFRESSHSPHRRDAQRLLRRRFGELGTGRHAPEAERVTFDDLVTLLLASYRLAGNRSLPRLQGAVKHLRQAFGASRAVDISAARLTAYASERIEAGAAQATVAYELAALKRAMNLAVKDGMLVYRPAFPTIKPDNTRTGFFEPDDFAALRAALPEYLRPVVTFAYLTGWRIRSEVLPLRWEQVDLDAGIVRLEPGTTKNRKGRTFPLRALPELEALLRAQRAHTDEMQRATQAIIPWVFHRRGKRMHGFYRAWRAARLRAACLTDAEGKPIERDGKRVIVRPALLGRIPHDLRRTAVRNLVRADVSEKVAMELTGHKTPEVFKRYDIVNERDLAEGVAKLAALRATQAEPTPSGRPAVGHSWGTVGGLEAVAR